LERHINLSAIVFVSLANRRFICRSGLPAGGILNVVGRREHLALRRLKDNSGQPR
jgi:hypothetical protein